MEREITPQKPDRRRAVGALVVLAVVVAVVISSLSGHRSAKAQATSFIEANGSDLVAVAPSVQAVLADITVAAVAAPSALVGDLVTLASDAQSAKSLLGNAQNAFDSGSGSDEVNVFSAAGELHSAMSKVLAWADKANATNTATAGTALQQAIADWNSSVRQLYADAGRTDAPTIRP